MYQEKLWCECMTLNMYNDIVMLIQFLSVGTKFVLKVMQYDRISNVKNLPQITLAVLQIKIYHNFWKFQKIKCASNSLLPHHLRGWHRKLCFHGSQTTRQRPQSCWRSPWLDPLWPQSCLRSAWCDPPHHHWCIWETGCSLLKKWQWSKRREEKSRVNANWSRHCDTFLILFFLNIFSWKSTANFHPCWMSTEGLKYNTKQ